jgi:NADH-quinone oxidoreductase subunit G
VPRRAGDRGALDAGCLPGLLPGGRPVADPAARVDVGTVWGQTVPTEAGRDGDAILAAAASGELGGLLVGGVELDDLADPAAARAAVRAAGFVVSLELRESDVTALADVVLPVAPPAEKSGSFVSWEGRVRPFPKALAGGNALPDVRVLAGVAEEMGVALGFLFPEQAGIELDELGGWDGERTAFEAVQPAPPPAGDDGPAGGEDRAVEGAGRVRLATWKTLVDDGRMQDGDAAYHGTARAPVVLVSPATLVTLGLPEGAQVSVSTEAGSVSLPVAVADLPDDVVWLPAHSGGVHVTRDLGAGHGTAVRVTPGRVQAELPPAIGGSA